MSISAGKGSSSGNQQAVLTPEQRQALAAQTQFLTGTAMPAYQNTIGLAGQAYGQAAPASDVAANQASQVAAGTGALQGAAGAQAYGTGLQGMASLFGPQYQQNQIQAALQSGREATRESLGQQNAMYGAAGGLGSARQALADTNLASLNAQRQATAAAGAQAQVQQNQLQAAQGLTQAGQTGLQAANQAAAARIGYAQTPQDVLAKYASVVFGIPQAGTTPNFSGTQGSTGQSTSKGSGAGITLSDIRTKQDIRKIGVLDNGLNIYQYYYKPEFRDECGHGLQIGVMAQEVEKFKPEAICHLSNGLKAVDYSMVLN